MPPARQVNNDPRMHKRNHRDAYLRPVFSTKNRLLRLAWMIVQATLFRLSPKPAHAWRIRLLRLFGAKMGSTNFVYPDCTIWAPWRLETEDVVTIGNGVEVYNPGGLFLGHHTILSQGAFLCGATHDFDSIEFTYVMKPIRTAPYTWICARSIVLPGVDCSEGSVLGAGSVASKNLKPWTVYAGNPAREIRPRHNFLKTNAQTISE